MGLLRIGLEVRLFVVELNCVKVLSLGWMNG